MTVIRFGSAGALKQFPDVATSAGEATKCRNGSLDKLWKPPPNRDYVPCVAPSPLYTSHPESRGYLLVHANGGLNQMRARDVAYQENQQNTY